MTKLKKIWKWIKDHFGWIIAGIVTLVIIAFATNKPKIVTKTDKIRNLEKAVVKTENEIHYLMGKKEMLKDDYAKNENAISDIDKKLKDLDNQLKLRRQELNKRTMEENLNRFKELGY